MIDPIDRFLTNQGQQTNVPTSTATTATTTQSQVGIAEAYALGINEALISTFPELKRIFDLFAAGNIAQARLEYFNTNYYKNLTTTGASRRADKATRPGVYAQEFDAWKQAQRVRLAAKGIQLTSAMDKLIEDSYLAGDTDVQLDMKILNSGMFGSIGGSALGAVNALKQRAFDEGVNDILGPQYWDKVSQGIFSGTLTAEDVNKEIQNFAMAAYPAYAPGIQAGRSFSLQTSALRQTVANLLEKDVDTINNNDPVFKQLVNWINPATGKQEAIPLWQAETIVKSQPDWLYTKNATATFDGLGLTVLKDYGVI